MCLQILSTLRQIAWQDEVPMCHATENLRESCGSERHPRDEGAAAGGWDGPHSERTPSRNYQASAGHDAISSSVEQPSAATGRRTEHGRASGRHPEQRQEQLNRELRGEFTLNDEDGARNRNDQSVFSYLEMRFVFKAPNRDAYQIAPVNWRIYFLCFAREKLRYSTVETNECGLYYFEKKVESLS